MPSDQRAVLQRVLPLLSERERRSVMRRLERGENVLADVAGSGDSDVDESEPSQSECERDSHEVSRDKSGQLGSGSKSD